MKKLVLLFVCIALILPCSVLAKKPGAKPTPVEVIPKVVDANGKTVGVILSAETGINTNVIIGMEYEGKKYIAKMKNGMFFYEDVGLFFDDTNCSSNPYIGFDSLESILNNFNTPFGVVKGDWMYLPVEGIEPVWERIVYGVKGSDAVCVPYPDGVGQTWAHPYEPIFEWALEFVPPYSIVKVFN